MSAVVLFVTGLIQGQGIMDMLLVAITLAVAAVPETLALIVTLILSYGAKKMATKNALVRQMQAVETLGSTSVICSDKTGTLTMNKMTVKRLWVYGGEPVAESGQFSEGQNEFLLNLCLACAATVGTDDEGNQKIMGDPTETAIVRLANGKGHRLPEFRLALQEGGGNTLLVGAQDDDKRHRAGRRATSSSPRARSTGCPSTARTGTICTNSNACTTGSQRTRSG